MKYFIPVIFMLVTAAVYGQQVRVKTMEDPNPRFKERKNTFPLVEIADDANIAKTINEYLRRDFLHIDTADVSHNIFADVNPDADDTHPPWNNIAFETRCNKGRLLSLAISATGCDAYCEDYTIYYTFDIRNGNRLWLDTLIKPEFKQVLMDSLNENKKSILTRKIARINDTLKTEEPWKNEEDPAYYLDMKRLYQDCLLDEKKDFSFLKFSLCKDQFYIEMDRCSAHYNRNLDELDVFGFYFSVSAWKKYFTEYALELVQ